MSGVRSVDVEGLTDPSLPFPTFTRAGDWVYLSGQVALDQDGVLVGPGDVALQTTATLRAVELALAAAGGGLDEVVSATVYLAAADLGPAFEPAWRMGFSGWRPARTTVVAPPLDPRFLIEVQIVARVPEARR